MYGSLDIYKYGDFYTMTKLSAFKIPIKGTAQAKLTTLDTNDAIFMLGDSYTQSGRVDSPCFNGARYVQHHYADNYLPAIIDSTKNNILVFEIIERDLLKTCKAIIGNQAPNIATTSGNLMQVYNRFAWLKPYFNTKGIEQNLEYLTSYNKPSNFLQELKADFKFHILNEIDPRVRYNSRTKLLYLNITIDSTIEGSCYKRLSDEDKHTIQQGFALYATHAKSVGFKKMIISVIPEKTRVYPAVEGVQNDLHTYLYQLQAQMPDVCFMDVLKTINTKKDNEMLWWPNDTHWKPAACDLWLAALNDSIASIKLTTR
ncbi:MAG: hypothetical protein RL660_2031 [Bacteroidota bacterium]